MNAEMNEQDRRRRIAEFPDPVRVLGYHHPLVKSVMDSYAHGAIITKEEALCRMVVELAKSDTEQKDKIHKMLVNGGGFVAP